MSTKSIVIDGRPGRRLWSVQVLSASDKPRLAGRQPSLRRGAPGDDLAERSRASASSGPRRGDERGATPVGLTGIHAAATALVCADLVGRPAVDLLRTDSALCR